MRHQFTQTLGEHDRFHARVHIHDRLLPRCDDRSKVEIALAYVALIIDVQIGAYPLICHIDIERQEVDQALRDRIVSGRGNGENLRVAERVQTIADMLVSNAEILACQPHMMGLIDRHESE